MLLNEQREQGVIDLRPGEAATWLVREKRNLMIGCEEWLYGPRSRCLRHGRLGDDCDTGALAEVPELQQKIRIRADIDAVENIADTILEQDHAPVRVALP